MPLAKLYVEGDIEVQLFRRILKGNPAVQQGGSKNSLKPRTRTDRQTNQVDSGYLRDRDFDFDPPADLSKPTVDTPKGEVAFGWRRCRHEIENYLIEPVVVGEATGWPIPDVRDALRQAAAKIRHYEAARWMIGVVRRSLPPHYNLETRPEDLNDIGLPPSLDSKAVNDWAAENVENHRQALSDAADPDAVRDSIDAFAARFDDAFIDDATKVLVWFSGKDLLAGMADWLGARGVPNPGLFRANLRDWIIANPESALELLPEWNGLIDVVRA